MTMMLRTLVFVIAVAGTLGSARGQLFQFTIVDSVTGRGVPLVEVKALDGTTWYTDSNGIVAIDEPSRLNQTLHFNFTSYGYQGFNKTFVTTAGSSAHVGITRNNRAERLYRVTGQGIYEDSVQVGAPVPIEKPVLNANVTGQDSVQNALYKGKVFWVWGDTNYVNGGFNLRVAAATSELPEQGGLNPSAGVNLNYFTSPGGNAKQMMPINEPGLVWLDGLFSLSDNNGQEKLLAHYSRIDPQPGNQFHLAEHGLALFNDTTETFQRLEVYDLDAPIYPLGHDFRHTVAGQEYIYFAQPYGTVRVKADWESVTDLSKWEAYTPLAPGARYATQNPPLERDGEGNLVWGWKQGSDPLSPDMLNELIQNDHLEREESPFRMKDFVTGNPVNMHRASIQWNEYRQNWVMIGQQSWGDSLIGEIWFAEAPTPEGPWENAVKIVTHARPGATYSFYNPTQHEYFDQEGGRYIYFEGTYTAWLGSADPTPLYDYNQVMYRLDLAAIPSLAGLGGDYDGDGDVDGEDFLAWQHSVGEVVQSGSGADGDGNGRVEWPDLAPWQLRFGTAAAGAAIAQAVTPEPSSLCLAAMLAGLALPRAVRGL